MSDVFSGGEAAVESATGSEKPLTDEERKLLQRLLSDPFSIPQPFKTWLVSYLEGSDMLLARSSIQGLNDLLGSGGGGQGIMGLLPAGIIFPYAGSGEPTGAKLCNGQSLLVANYKRLFDAIGYMYGGSGANFNVPDMRRRIPWGQGAGVGLGASDGRAEANRHIDHHHYFQDTKGVAVSGVAHGVGDHAHGTPGETGQGFNIRGAATGTQVPYLEGRGGGTHGAGGHSHSVEASGTVQVSGDTSGGYDNNRPAFLVVGYIINY